MSIRYILAYFASRDFAVVLYWVIFTDSSGTPVNTGINLFCYVI